MSQEIVKYSDAEIGTFLKENSERLAKFAVREYRQEEFLRSAVLAISESERLQECLSTPEGRSSMYGALKRASSTGLSLSPQEGKACLVAYNGKVSYQIMKGGMIDLALETGKIEHLTHDLVRKEDFFTIEKTSEGDSYRYQPALEKRGQVIGFFAACKLKTGKVHVKYMSAEEIDEFADRYNSSKKLGDNSPWNHSPIGMAMKTVLKALLRNLHIGPAVEAAITSEDLSENEWREAPIDVTPRGTSSEDVRAELLSRKEPEDVPPPEEAPDDEPEDAREHGDPADGKTSKDII